VEIRKANRQDAAELARLRWDFSPDEQSSQPYADFVMEFTSWLDQALRGQKQRAWNSCCSGLAKGRCASTNGLASFARRRRWNWVWNSGAGRSERRRPPQVVGLRLPGRLWFDGCCEKCSWGCCAKTRETWGRSREMVVRPWEGHGRPCEGHGRAAGVRGQGAGPGRAECGARWYILWMVDPDACVCR
jgi:hypothetical protein